MRNFGRILAVIIILGIAAVVLYMCTTAEEEPAEEPLPPIVEEPAPVVEPEPEPLPEAEPQMTMAAEPEPEPVLLEPASCAYPGDGFMVTPHGFSPMAGQEIVYDDATYESGYNGAPLPMRDEVDLTVAPSACVIVTYDISASGRPVNVQVYDVAINGDPAAEASAWYEREAIAQVGTRVYDPASRNGKAIRLDNNVMTVRFGAL